MIFFHAPGVVWTVFLYMLRQRFFPPGFHFAHVFSVSRTRSPFPRPTLPVFPRPVAGHFQKGRRGRASSSQLACRPARMFSRILPGALEMAAMLPGPREMAQDDLSTFGRAPALARRRFFPACFFCGARRFSCPPRPEPCRAVPAHTHTHTHTPPTHTHAHTHTAAAARSPARACPPAQDIDENRYPIRY